MYYQLLTDLELGVKSIPDQRIDFEYLGLLNQRITEGWTEWRGEILSNGRVQYFRRTLTRSTDSGDDF